MERLMRQTLQKRNCLPRTLRAPIQPRRDQRAQQKHRREKNQHGQDWPHRRSVGNPHVRPKAFLWVRRSRFLCRKLCRELCRTRTAKFSTKPATKFTTKFAMFDVIIIGLGAMGSAAAF